MPSRWWSETLKLVLRAVPTIVTAHTFCASRDTRVFLAVMLTNSDIFAWVKTIRRK